MNKKIKDLTGKRFGRLTAIEFTGVTVPGRGAIWLCKCDCGNYRKVSTNHLNYGQITQCEECVKRKRSANMEKVVVRCRKRNKLRDVWNNIKYRCFNPDCSSYKHYGGRGITMCDEWATNYEVFRDWALSHGYKEGLTIERIDVNSDYCPENCCFVSLREQEYNRRDSLRVVFNDVAIPVGTIAYKLGINCKTFVSVLKRCAKELDDHRANM